MLISNPEFQTYQATEEGILRIRQTRALFDGLLNNLKDLLPEGREFSLVKTKLEEASFFAIKAISKAHQVSEATKVV